jgi:hypothetical protein
MNRFGLMLERGIMTSVYDHLTRILSNAVSSKQRLAAMRGFSMEAFAKGRLSRSYF